MNQGQNEETQAMISSPEWKSFLKRRSLTKLWNMDWQNQGQESRSGERLIFSYWNRILWGYSTSISAAQGRNHRNG